MNRQRGAKVPVSPVRNHNKAGAAICAVVLLLDPVASFSQYSYDPSNLDEQGPGIKYFGSIKDDRGALLQNAVVMIQRQYLLISDAQGRFRANLPADLPADKVDVSCSNPGFQTVRIVKRLGPKGPKTTVQIDCIMRANK